MLLANKIKQSQESIESKYTGFKTFIETLRENRSQVLPLSRKFNQNSENYDHLNDHEHPSQTNHSEIIHMDRTENEMEKSLSNLSSGAVAPISIEGDRAISNKLRFSVGNRHRVDRYRLPAYCFQQIKEDLDEHLKGVKRDDPKVILGLVENKHKRAQVEEDFSELMEQKGIYGEEKPRKISALNPTIVLKYCTINKISSTSSLKEILMFFTRLFELLSFSMTQPKVEKYKNCVYFGQPIKKHLLYEGIVYYYCGIVYFGELFNNQKHGMGVEIDLQKSSIFKGEFRDGEMVGSFEVQRDGEKYVGELENGLYHGRGKLIDGQQVFEGQFRAGKKVYGTTNKPSSNPKRYNNSNRLDRSDSSYWSAEKELSGSRTGYLQFSKNKIRPVNSRDLSRGSNWQLNLQSERKKPSNRGYIQQTRDFSYPLHHEMGERSFNPQLSEVANSKKTSRVASLRIRQVGKLHSSRIPQPEEDQQRPLRNKL